MGRTDVEDGFQRLDTLTKEETLMAVTRNLEVTHHIDDNVMAVKGIVHNIDGNTKETKEVICDVDGNIRKAKEVIHDIDGNVKESKEVIRDVDGNVKEIKEVIDGNVKETKALTENIDDNVKVIQGVACSVDHNVKVTKDGTHRFLSVSIHDTHYDPSQRFPQNSNRPTKKFVPHRWCSRWLSMLRHIHREPATREASNMVRGSRSLHQSQHRVQNSTRRDCKVVYSR